MHHAEASEYVRLLVQGTSCMPIKTRMGRESHWKWLVASQHADQNTCVCVCVCVYVCVSVCVCVSFPSTACVYMK